MDQALETIKGDCTENPTNTGMIDGAVRVLPLITRSAEIVIILTIGKAMTDFQDFLKRKYAYVARGEFKPGQFGAAKDLYDEAVATYREGFQGAYLLQEPGTDRGIAVIFWESPGDMEAHRTEAYEAIMQKMGPMFAQPPETGIYEVVEESQSAIAPESP